MVRPGLQAHVSIDVTTGFLVLFVLTAVCFIATGRVNPGVPDKPNPAQSSGTMSLAHPGDEYQMSRDTNRYVLGFDHFCEFVGNDIGRGNLPCFVTFLVLLSLLSTYVVICSGWITVLYWLPPLPEYHLLADPWRLGIAAVIVLLVAWGLKSCLGSESCQGVIPLVMMLPGAWVGAVLVVLVLGATLLLPLTTDMLSNVTPLRNPTAFFLILPCLIFATLFWSMSAHWVHLLWDGISQKMWLRAQGFRKQRSPAAPTDNVGGEAALV